MFISNRRKELIMKIITLNTYIEVQDFTIKKCNELKEKLLNKLLNDEEATTDFIHANALIIAAKKNLEELTEKLQIAEENKNVQK